MLGNCKKLYIYTFGGLVIKKGDDILFSGNKKINKRWKLFLLLLFRSGETISDQQLINELDLADNFTPRQSLRALVYRLRKEIEKNDNESFIYTDRGGYGFNPESRYWLDCQQFEDLITKAKESNNSTRKVSILYQQALNLYKGCLLDNHILKDRLLLQKRNILSDLYLEVVKELPRILEKSQSYDRMEDLYETASQLYPFNIELYLGLINTLKQAGKADLAQNRAEEALAFLRNAGREIPVELEKEVSSFFQIDLNKTPEFALDNNKISRGSVFECGPMTFSNIYNLEKRRTDRIDQDIFLIHYQLSKSGLPNQIREAEKILRQTLQETLRISDVITRWEPSHYLQLAVNLSDAKIEKILQRIEIDFRDQFPPAEVNLTYKYEKI